MDETPVLELRGITKRFPGVVANDGVDFDLRAGEVHALLGENGAGKSTLMNILYGLYTPGRGRDPDARRAGRDRTRPADAIERGIGMVHQHFMLVPVMTVAENIVLARRAATRGRCSTRRGAERRVRELSQRYGLAVDPDALVETITVGQQQRVEILKALYRERGHPHPRRADGRADAAGGEGAVRRSCDAAREGTSVIFITPQAGRGAGDRRPDHGAAARQEGRDGADARARPRQASPG